MKTIKIKVNLRCPSCVLKIESALRKHTEKADVNFILQIVRVVYDENKISESKIRNIIIDMGYDVN